MQTMNGLVHGFWDIFVEFGKRSAGMTFQLARRWDRRFATFFTDISIHHDRRRSRDMGEAKARESGTAL
jgi:hypothetical protein